MRKTPLAVIGVLAMVAFPTMAPAAGWQSAPVSTLDQPSITYTGQGMGIAGPNTQKCGTAADNGGTGQAIPANGQYLLWVLNGSVTGPVTLTLPDGNHQMVKVGSTWKYLSALFTRAQLVALPAKATFVSGTANNLVSWPLSSWLKCGTLWNGTNWTSQAGVGVE
jgi:hypothetical protein